MKIIYAIFFAFLLFVFLCAACAGGSSSSSSSSHKSEWAKLNDQEKANARWAYEVQQYIQSQK